MPDTPPPDGEDSNNGPGNPNRGVTVAIGTGAGAAMFAATGSPVWIAIGAGIGGAIGAAMQGRS